MTDFFRFPQTPHLVWLGEEAPREDKLLEPHQMAELLKSLVIVEEKIDGANLGFSTTADGELRVQNRGAYLDPVHSHRQFQALWPWLMARSQTIIDALWPDLVLFGEWCWAVHSIRYTSLPDWFVGFDVYDQKTAQFWSSERRNSLLSSMGLSTVPRLATGHFDLEELRAMLGSSRFGHDAMEGLIIRQESDGWTTGRAKLVRASFTQSIEEHWSRGPIQRNQLYYESSPP